jgi:hypothetical protein
MNPQEALAVASGIMTEMGRARAASTTSVSLDCTNGGTISGSANFTSNLNNAGTGSITGSLTVTPQACKVSNGTKLITVGGQLTFDFSMNLNQGAPVGESVWHGKGNLTWDDGNCNIDYTMTANFSAPGHGSITGTFCGATLNSTV